MNDAFSEQLDAVIRANKPQTVNEVLLDSAAVLLRGLLSRSPSARVADWLREYEQYRDAPTGFEYVWMPETDPRWELMEQPTKAYACRGSLSCEEVVVVRLNRVRDTTKPSQWWRYCAGHMFGRRIRDGKLEVRKLVPKGSAR